MIKQRLIELLTEAASQAQQLGKLPAVTLPDIVVEHPQNAGYGDYASSLPLKLARATGLSPLTIANDIVGLMAPTPEVAGVAVAPPGFINFTLKDDWLTQQVDSILMAGDAYGNIVLGEGSRVQIEFVSVNPTGPLHVGHGRGAILGSTLANVLAAADYKVEKEYYINDAGSQIVALIAHSMPAISSVWVLMPRCRLMVILVAIWLTWLRRLLLRRGTGFLVSPKKRQYPN